MLVKVEEKEDYSVIEGVPIGNLRPMPHHILVRWPGKNETKGGILIPQDRERLGRMNGEVLAVGPDCDDRLHPGKLVQFSGVCEKEFLGSQSPNGRDPVFFMREEDLFGILYKDHKGFDVTMELLNGFVLTRPERKPFEISGVIVPDRDAKDSFGVWGEVLQIDRKAKTEFNVGDSVLYPRNIAEEIRVGDYSSEVLHLVRTGWKGHDIEAMKEKEIEIQGAD